MIVTRTLDRDVVRDIAATIFLALQEHGVKPDASYTVGKFTATAYKLQTGGYVVRHSNDGETGYAIVRGETRVSLSEIPSIFLAAYSRSL